MTMMNKIKKQTVIDVNKLSGEFYFQSLLQEAYVKGVLSPNESERIQLECLKLPRASWLPTSLPSAST